MQHAIRPASTAERVVNALTVDVEDYFQVSALAPHFPRDGWEQQPMRVQENVARILALFERADVKATFFTLGWVAERFPETVKAIAAAGHEVASHGYAHHRATELSPALFLDDIRRAKRILEDLSQAEVKGYRAPSFSIGPANDWAFDCISEAGYRYSSSIYPVRHDHYGVPDAPRFLHNVRGSLIEVPITTTPLLGRNLPVGGGGYFRLLPYSVSSWLIRRVNRQEGQSAIFYFHPWEIDPAQPRVRNAKMKTRFRHYLNLHRTERRLERLLGDFHWDRVDRVFLGQGA